MTHTHHSPGPGRGWCGGQDPHTRPLRTGVAVGQFWWSSVVQCHSWRSRSSTGTNRTTHSPLGRQEHGGRGEEQKSISQITTTGSTDHCKRLKKIETSGAERRQRGHKVELKYVSVQLKDSRVNDSLSAAGRRR